MNHLQADAAAALSAFAHESGLHQAKYTILDRPDGPYLVIEVVAPSERFYASALRVSQQLPDANVFRDRLTVRKRGAGAKPSSASSPIFWSPEGGNPSLIRSTVHQRQRRAVTQRSRNKLASSRKKTATRASPGWSTRKQPQKPRVDAWGGNDGVNSIPKLHERVRT